MKSHNKLTDYYFTATKNDDTEFTHSELLSVVESATDDNPRGTGNYSTKQTVRRIIMLSLLTLAGTIAATFLWLSAPTAPQAAHKERMNTPVNPDKQTPAPAPTLPIQKFKKSASSHSLTKLPPPHEIIAEESFEKPKKLDIQGITTLSLDNSELKKIGVSLGEHCGIRVDKLNITTTYYKVEEIQQKLPAPEGTEIQARAFIPEADKVYTFELVNRSAVLPKSLTPEEKYQSITVRDVSKNPILQTIYPVLITSMKGQIVADELESRLGVESSSQKKQDLEWLSTHNPENKQTLLLYLYPNDTTWSEKQIGDILSDPKLLVLFRRFTQEDIDRMKNEQDQRTQKINEYLRMNNLIAVKLESACPNHSLLLWYEPNEEFINNLNERYRAGLYKVMLGKNYMPVTTDTLWLDANTSQEKPQTGCQFTDICRATSGAVLESNVFPNPATEKISLTFRLNAERRCTFSLHDLNGVYIKSLGTDIEYLKGEQTFTAPLGETGPGVYLLSMHTDKDERIVQRVIIKK